VIFVGRNSSLEGVRTENGERTVQELFDTVPGAFRSMFAVMTLDGWDQICRPISKHQPGLVLFFIGFIVLFTFGVLNMVIALAIQKTKYHAELRATQEESEKRRVIGDFLGELRERSREFRMDRIDGIDGLSEDGPGNFDNLNFIDIQGALDKNDGFADILENEGFGKSNLQRLFDVLDSHGTGVVPSCFYFNSLRNLLLRETQLWDEMTTLNTLRHTRNDLRNFCQRVSDSRQERVEWIRQVQKRQRVQGTLLQTIQGCLGEEPANLVVKSEYGQQISDYAVQEVAAVSSTNDVSCMPCCAPVEDMAASLDDSLETFVVPTPLRQDTLRATARAGAGDQYLDLASSSLVAHPKMPNQVAREDPRGADTGRCARNQIGPVEKEAETAATLMPVLEERGEEVNVEESRMPPSLVVMDATPDVSLAVTVSCVEMISGLPRGRLQQRRPQRSSLEVDCGLANTATNTSRNSLASLASKATEGIKQTSRKFDICFGGLTILNLLVLAAETNVSEEESKGEGWIIVDSLFIVAFLIEIACRLYWEREEWPRKVWNWFDVVITLLAMVDTWILTMVVDSSSAMQVMPAVRVLRMFRLVRMLKFMKHSQEVYIILLSFLQTLQALWNLVLVLIGGIFVYSIVLAKLIGRNGRFSHVVLHDGSTIVDRFGTVPRTMYALFELMTLEGWTLVYRPIVRKEPLLFVPVAFFIMVFTIGMLNMVVAFVLETNMSCRAEIAATFAEDAEQQLNRELNSALRKMREGRVQIIDYPAFQDQVKSNASLRRTLAFAGCNPRSYLELCEVFDWDESGTVEEEEILTGCSKLLDSRHACWNFLATRAISNELRSQISTLCDDLSRSRLVAEHRRKAIDDVQATQDVALDRIARKLSVDAGWQRDLRRP